MFFVLPLMFEFQTYQAITRVLVDPWSWNDSFMELIFRFFYFHVFITLTFKLVKFIILFKSTSFLPENQIFKNRPVHEYVQLCFLVWKVLLCLYSHINFKTSKPTLKLMWKFKTILVNSDVYLSFRICLQI